MLEKVMSDEAVEPGEKILTSGGDRIFPKGLAVGTVSKVSPGPELFLNIRVKPSVNLGKLEEVLVITQQEEREPELADGKRMRAADILAQRLPSVPETKPLDNPFAPPPPTSALAIAPAKPAAGANTNNKPQSAGSATTGPTASANSKPSGGGLAGTTNSAGVKPAVNSPVIKPTSGQKPVLQVAPKPNAASAEGENSPKSAQPEPGASPPPALVPPPTQPQDQPQ
jgi:rod shape-determining protein MreC